MSRTDAAHLKAYVQSLPQTDRYILLLSMADGLTLAEVALVLNLPQTTVETRLTILRMEADRVISRVREAAQQAAVAHAVGVVDECVPVA